MTTQEFIDEQVSWLDTSQVQRASRQALNQVLILALDHLKYQTRLSRADAMASLCGKLLKLRETFEQPVVTCSDDEVLVLIRRYVQMLYQHFDDVWHGSLANLTHQRESLEESFYFQMLERRGEKRGGAGRGQGRKPEFADPVTVTFKVERELAERLSSRANDEGKSSAELIREMIAHFLRA